MDSEVYYANTFYNAENLRHYADKYLAVLPEDVTVLLSRGSSGNAIASAMLARSDRQLHHVALRKMGESAHSAQFAGQFPTRKDVIAIVDDFIRTGGTYDALKEWARQHELKISYVVVWDIQFPDTVPEDQQIQVAYQKERRKSVTR